jgi:hypothetical protein
MEALPTLPNTPGNSSRRSVPDVPENVDFYMDHLNDPNFDFVDAQSPRSKYDSFELERKPSPSFYATSEAGTESQYGSDRHLVSSKTESLRTSLAFDFDEYVLSFFQLYPLLSPISESPYPEVRAAVATVDDPFMPVNTFRM